MNDKVIKVLCDLKKEKNDKNEEVIVLDFGNEIGKITFNDDNQKNISLIFGNLLKTLIDNNIEVELQDIEGEIKPSYIIDVAEEYIKQLNVELSKVKDHLDERFTQNEKDK